MSDRGFISVVFKAEIKISPEELDEAQGNLSQAVQNEIGHTGAVVTDILDNH